MRPRSKKRAVQELNYRTQVRPKYLSIHESCARCGSTATEIHHMKGRSGELLMDSRFFVAVCRNCHEWIENHPVEAKELGYSISRLAKV